jgi:hypothetical protein
MKVNPEDYIPIQIKGKYWKDGQTTRYITKNDLKEAGFIKL